MKKVLFLLSLLPLFALGQSLSSPDGKYTINMDGMNYTITYNNKVIVERSQLGVDIDNRLFESALAVPRGENENWCSDLELKGEERITVDTTWTPLYGENNCIRDHYNQMVLHYEKGSNGQGVVSEGYDKRKYYAMDIVVRAYNEGIAFRYHFPEVSNNLFLHIKDEFTSFRMPDGTMAWYEEWAQGPYIKRDLKMKNEGCEWFESERPLLLQVPSGHYVALLEAQMKDYTRGKFRLKAENELQVAMYDCADIISPYNTPWRVVMVGEKAVDLINHKEIILNLNEERAIGDWTWVRPGKAFRSCRLDKEN
ncbi:MAG: glycoside hydrolase family 97 N-terminal domain-containing protein, partial [Paraprevotella sp.]|nr:glycoside hydrolase family 97 N-terminal domain-containing protein [Paraprevotella sp.]